MVTGFDSVFSVESSHLPIQLQCRCPFLTVIQVSGITLKNFAGQYSPAENVFPGIEVAAETECRQQMPNDLRKCDLYLTPYDVSAHSTEIVILYNCLANESVLNSSKIFDFFFMYREYYILDRQIILVE